MARAAAAAGSALCLSTFSTASAAEVAAAAPDGVRFLQVYVFRDHGVTDELIAQAVDVGFSARLPHRRPARASGCATGSGGSTGRSRTTRSPRCATRSSAGTTGASARPARPGARLGLPRAARRRRVPVPVVVKGVLDPDGRGPRGRARRRRDRRLEPRRPSARRRRCRRSRRCPRSSTAVGDRLEVLARRRHPARHRRRDGARARRAGACSPAACRSGASPPAARRARGPCSSSSARSSRSPST